MSNVLFAVEAVRQLKELQALAKDDAEAAHSRADDILIRFLRDIAYHDVADAWEAIKPKWYA